MRQYIFNWDKYERIMIVYFNISLILYFTGLCLAMKNNRMTYTLWIKEVILLYFISV